MVRLNSIAPFFIVAVLQKSVDFYTTKLGFELRYAGPGDSPFFAMVGRDDISIMLKEIGAGIQPAPNHTIHEWARWDAFIHVSDPDALFEAYRANDVVFRQSIRNDDDRLRGFEVRDADGYVLFFGRPLSS